VFLRGDMQRFHFHQTGPDRTGYVENVALSSLNQLYMGSNTDGFRWDGKDPAKKVLITEDYITREYFRQLE